MIDSTMPESAATLVGSKPIAPSSSTASRKQRNSSIDLCGPWLTVNSMSNEVLRFDTRTMTESGCPPLVFKGHKSTFYTKAASNSTNQLIASGSQDNHVYVWEGGH